MSTYQETCDRYAGVIAGYMQRMSPVEFVEFARLLAVTMCMNRPQCEKDGLHIITETAMQIEDSRYLSGGVSA